MNQRFILGLEKFLLSTDKKKQESLEGKRIALLSHPAGVDSQGIPNIDRIAEFIARIPGATFSALFGPQHGLRGEKQDNMVESYDYKDPDTGLPAFSLYGTTRRLTPEMLDSFDVLLVDLQDVGVRVYTFLTTVGYLVEDLSAFPEKELIILDRPNPTGRLIEGNTLEQGWTSFVGIDSIPMQHGLTLGEFALWFKAKHGFQTRITVELMEGWNATDPSRAWPVELVWLQPSPNMPSLTTARCYPGTVMLEGTTLSEARGTTRPLSQFGYPNLDWKKIAQWIYDYSKGSLDIQHYGALIRSIAFQPTFHKHQGVITPGLELVPEGRFYNPDVFKPFRLIAGIFKAIHALYPSLVLWTQPPYEYEYEKIPIDVITGGTRFRTWVENPSATWQDFETWLEGDEQSWREESRQWYLYE